MRSLLLLTAAAIFAVGLVMIFSTTSAEILDHDLDKNTYHALVRQLGYAFIGVGMACVSWKIGYSTILNWSPQLLLFFSFLLLLVLLPGIGKEVNGSKRWLKIGSLSLQPSEFVKYLVPAFFIHRIMRKKKVDEMTFLEFLKLVGVVIVPILLVLVEPNNGTAVVMGVTVAMLCFITRISFKYWAWPLLILVMAGGVFAYHLPYVSARIKVYLHPELDLKGKGHQPYQAKIAAGSGQLFGKGPGNSLQKLSYLPEAQNDYIAAIYAEEFGFLGIVGLITLYALLGYLGFHIAMHASEQGGQYMAIVVTFLICFQAFLNLGVVSGLLPSTGLNLPLFSQGGSSLMANACGIGLLLSISREDKIKLLN